MMPWIVNGILAVFTVIIRDLEGPVNKAGWQNLLSATCELNVRCIYRSTENALYGIILYN